MKIPNWETREYLKATQPEVRECWKYFTDNNLIEPEVQHVDWPSEVERVKKQLSA